MYEKSQKPFLYGLSSNKHWVLILTALKIGNFFASIPDLIYENDFKFDRIALIRAVILSPSLRWSQWKISEPDFFQSRETEESVLGSTLTQSVCWSLDVAA